VKNLCFYCYCYRPSPFLAKCHKGYGSLKSPLKGRIRRGWLGRWVSSPVSPWPVDVAGGLARASRHHRDIKKKTTY
jgi:hypothetical protein